MQIKTATVSMRSPALIFAVALAARIALLVGLYASPVPGLSHFWDTGIEVGNETRSLLAGAGFASPFGGSTGPSAMLSPVYPALVAAVFRIGGPFTAVSAWTVLGLQALFSALTGAVIFWIGKKSFGKICGAVAAWMWALCPATQLLPAFRFWETSLGTLLFAAAFLALLWAAEDERRSGWGICGLLAGAAGLVNPTTLPCSVLIAARSLWRGRRRAVFGSAVAGLAGLAIVLVPWLARNYLVFHRVVPVRSNFGLELWMGNHPGATGHMQMDSHPATSQDEFQSYQRAGEFEYFRRKRDVALAFIGAHPGTFARLTVRRIAYFWGGWSELFGFAASVVPVVLLGLFGLGWLVAHGDESAATYGIPMAIFPLPFYITVVDTRFRHVIEPLLFVLAANLIVKAAARWKSGKASPEEVSSGAAATR